MKLKFFFLMSGLLFLCSMLLGVDHWTEGTVQQQRVIIAADDYFSDYTLDWHAIAKGYASVGWPFVPYVLGCAEPFSSPSVAVANISPLPTIQGTVDRFQIKGSCLGTKAHVLVDGGTVNELIVLDSCRAADVTGAVIVLQNEARVGLGSVCRSDYLCRPIMVLGANGITLVPNGDATIELHEDLIINDRCQILAGPDFGLQGTSFESDVDATAERVCVTQMLEIHSDTGKSIIVKAGGQLDLTSFTSENKVLAFSGDARLVLEHGAEILMNGGTLLMTDEAEIVTQCAS